MNITIHGEDGIGPELRRIAGVMARPRRLLAAVGKQLEVDLRKHFARRDAEPNAQGWPKRHFWKREVAQHTALTEVSDDQAVVSIASPAFVHKLLGGKVTPKRGRALSIPLSADAYRAGSASLFPRPLSRINRPGKPPLLVEKDKDAWHLHYVLLTSVTHDPDPDALPSRLELEESLLARARALLARVTRPQ